MNKYPNINAAAGDLLAALEAIIYSSLSDQVMPGHFNDEWNAAYAAIAKAKEAQGTLAPYPDGPAVGKTDTSAQAAQKIAVNVGTLRHTVLETIKQHGPLSCEQIERRALILNKTAGARLTELKLGGYIEDSGKRRKNMRGNNEIIWKTVTPQGD